MKKQVVLLLMMLLPMVAGAQGVVEIDGICYELVSKIKEATVNPKNNGYYSGNVVIPDSVTYEGAEYNVTSIGKSAFRNCSGLTSVTISNSVTSIGGGAFSGCSSLTSVTIPNSVTSIEVNAFAFCRGLTSVTIPNSVASIGDGAFNGCSSLTSVTIPNSVTSIGSAVFQGCSGLTSVTIPNSVTSIGGYAFYNCCILTSVTIPNSVTSIGDGAFRGCSGLTSVTIPNSVTSIGSYAFSDCSGLISVTIGSGVKKIGQHALASCKELMDVYCLAEEVPTIIDYRGNSVTDAFQDSHIEYATLHVPNVSIDAYKAKEPWKNFKSIVGLDGTIVETPKCATPTIAFVDGELVFSCETEGVEYVSEVTSAETKKYYDSKVKIGGKYKVTVYATKPGYEDSDVATMEFTIGAGGDVCDVNQDGAVDVADISAIISRMAEKARMLEEIEE